MKKTLLPALLFLISIHFVSAQNTININKSNFSDFEEMYGPRGELNFADAIRFRQMNPNEKIQYEALVQVKDVIHLDLFNDKKYRATVDKVKKDANGTLLVRAKLEGYDYAYCFISTFEGKSFIVIEVPEEDELYMSRYNHSTNTYHLLEMDKTKLNQIEACFGNDDLILKNKATNTNEKSLNNSPIVQQSPTSRDTITLLVVYTPAAAAWSASNEVSINNTINLMMARAELTNDNSDSLLYIELVHSEEVAYTELRSVQDLFNLRNTNDGIMDTVHTLRDLHCADLVTLMEQTNHTGGTAFLLNNINGSPANGFSILRVQQSSWTYTAIHEFGHNLGCGHHKFQNFQAGPGIFSYSAGSRWVSVPSGNYCSIMAYENGSYYTNNVSHTRVAHFSNPSISYQGTSTGDTTDADNARTIRTTKSVVAAYRSGCALPSPVIVSGKGGTYCDSVILTASGGLRGTIYWQGTVRGDTSTAFPSSSQTVTASGTYYFRAKNLNGWGPEDSSTVTIINNPPPAAGPISGPTTVCLGQTVGYSIPPIPGATSYVWTLPPGVTAGRNVSDTITVTYTNSAVSGNITVTGVNVCDSGVVATLAITVNQIPANAGLISGPKSVCPGQTVTYAVPSIADASAYTWTLPSGATGTSTTDSITVTYSNAAVSGDIMVKGTNSCGIGDSSTLAITVNPFPANAGTISGPTGVCPGQTVTYAVPTIADATSYNWILPSGATGTSTTDSITVNFSNAAVSGDITVRGMNSCGVGDSSTLAITVNPFPANAGLISGPTSVCPGQTVNYAVPSIADATSYNWTLPSGATGTSTSDSISVTYSNTAVSGDITVRGTNTCGLGDSSILAITVNPFPANAGLISGPTSVCPGQTITYAVPAIANASSYNWTLPSGVTGTSTSDSISVTFSNAAVSGDITVRGTNTCGVGDSSILAITVNPFPASAGLISGPTTVCPGQTVTYAVPTIADASSYTWTLPSGATGTSSSDSITVNFSNAAVSGDITVRGTNTCGNGDSSILAITVNPFPANAGLISGATSVCPGQTVTYAVPTIANASSYNWTLPSGATGTSTIDSIIVNFSNTAVSGDITVRGTNTCGVGDSSTLAITVNPFPASAGLISGSTGVCPGQTVTYAVPSIADATSYTWTLPSGATGTSTTDSITVNFSNAAVSGDISVRGTNSCGLGDSSTLAITVNPFPANAGLISGPTTVCQGQTETYIVPTIADASSYNWTLPSGATGTSTIDSIIVNFSNTAVSGDITVRGTNTCGNGLASSLSVTVDTLPARPTITQNGSILTSDAPTGNQWYDQNGLIIGATNQSYTVTSNGDYYAIVTLMGCKSDTSNIINVLLTGIESNVNEINLSIYPNPFNNDLTIEIEGNDEIINLEIFSTSGQLVYKGTMKRTKNIQTNNLAKGIYFIKLENENLFEIKKLIRN